MKINIKKALYIVIFIFTCLALLIFMPIFNTVWAEDIDTNSTHGVGLENIYGYGCDIHGLSQEKIDIANNDLELYHELGCKKEHKQPGREYGYTEAYFDNDCRNWQAMPMYEPFYRYYIDRDSLKVLSEEEQQLFIANTKAAVEMWNSCRMYDGSGRLIYLVEQEPDGVYISGAYTCPVIYNPNLKNRGEFTPIPFGYKIEIRVYDTKQTIAHEFGHMLGLQDLDMNRDDYIHTALMGYGSPREDLSYHDIQGIAVSTGVHDKHDFKRYRKYGAMYQYVCYYCDIITFEPSVLSNSAQFEYADDCMHDFHQIVSGNGCYWLKCTKCYKVIKTKSLLNLNDGVIQYKQVNESYVVAEILNNDNTHISIPPKFNGLPVVEIGDSAFKNLDSLQSVTIPEGLKVIGNSAFYNCIKLNNIALPDSLIKVSDSAFYNCVDLECVELNDGLSEIGNNAFYGCTKIGNINIPISVTSIGDAAFKYCIGITEISIPENVTQVNDSVFEYCTELKSITLPENLQSIGDSAFCGTQLREIIIPNTVVSIGDLAFAFCANLVNVKIPNSVTKLGACAFLSCVNLESIELPINLRKLDTGTFMACESLEYIHIPYYVTYVGNEAFRNSGIKSISLPDTITVLSDGIFQNCANLTAVYVSESLKTISDDAFNGCSSLASIELPYTLISIGQRAFKDCFSLEYIDIHSGIELIDNEAFSGCISLSSFHMPITVEHIGDGAFKDCSALEYAEISDSVRVIPDYAFSGCANLQTVRISNNVTHIGAYAFSNSGINKLVIPRNVISIGEYAFENSALTDMQVAYENECFTTQNGVLYDSNKFEILYIPDKIDHGIAIPKTVKKLKNGLFSNRKSLTSVTIPYLINIGDSAFVGCDNLTIYVERFSSKPSEWSSSWNISNRPVFWDCDLNNNGVVISIMKSNTSITNLNNCEMNEPVWEGHEFDGWAISINSRGIYSMENIVRAYDRTYYVSWIDSLDRDFAFTLVNGTYEIGVKSGSVLMGNVVIPREYQGKPVTKIADFGFCDNYYGNANARTRDMMSVVLPDTITEIGKCGFANCSGMSDFEISDYSQIIEFGEQAFGNCSSLNSIYIPNEVLSIKALCFMNCTALSDIRFDVACKLKEIGHNAFDSCHSLMSIEIPDSVISIGDYAFTACDNLRNIYLPEEITDLPDGLFMGCGSLEYISIPESVRIIGNNTFNNCALKDVIIPGSIMKIGDYAFKNCDIDSITISGENSVYEAIDNCLIESYSNTLLVGTNNSEIPDTVKKIAPYAFYGCSMLISIIIPDSVVEIGNYAFGFCDALQSVEIATNSDLRKIDNYAFYYSAINEINIPSNVNFIGHNAFYNCANLNDVYFAVTAGWWRCNYQSDISGIGINADDLANSYVAAQYLRNDYYGNIWKR